MTDQETFGLLLFLGWLAMMATTVPLTELDRHRRGRDVFDWIKSLARWIDGRAGK